MDLEKTMKCSNDTERLCKLKFLKTLKLETQTLTTLVLQAHRVDFKLSRGSTD